MSERDAPPDTVAKRVRALIASLPPKEGRRNRIDHVSVEDFAELLGTTKQRVIDWTKGRSYPDETNRKRLAAVSNGRYTPDDFKNSAVEENATRVALLEAEVGDLQEQSRAAKESMAALLRRVKELEAAAQSPPVAPATRREERNER